MSATTSTLPDGWSDILDEVQKRLDHAVALADARMEEIPHLDAEMLGREQRKEIVKWSDRFRRLSAYLASAQQIVQAWMNSPPHRQEILTRAFRRVGVGAARGGPWTIVTANFTS